MVWTLRICLALTAALVLAAPAQAAKNPFKTIRTPVGVVLTDGTRYAAYIDAATRETVVIDTAAGTTRRFPTPPACRLDSTILTAMGSGLLVWRTCGSYPGTSTILDIASGATVGEITANEEASAPVDIGRVWVRVVLSGYHYVGAKYLNWRTGQMNTEPLTSTRQWPSLDSDPLYQPTCSKLTRVKDPNDDPYENRPTYTHFTQRGDWALTSTVGDFDSGWRGSLLLERCGQSKPIVLDRCAPTRSPCHRAQLGTRAAVWITDRLALGAYYLAKRRSVRWDVGQVLSAGVTDTSVFVYALVGKQPRVLSAPLRDVLAKRR